MRRPDQRPGPGGNSLGARAARRFGTASGPSPAGPDRTETDRADHDSSEPERPDLAVRVSAASLPGQSTALDVAVENQSGRSILLYLPLGQYSGGVWQPGPGRYECLADGDEGVEIAWRVHAVPAGVRVQCPVVPFMTLLRADQQHVTSIVLPTPLSVRWSYRQCAIIKAGEAGSASPTEVRSLRVGLGYAWAPPGLEPAGPVLPERDPPEPQPSAEPLGSVDADWLWRGRPEAPVWPVDAERPELFQAGYEWAVANQRVFRTEPIAVRLQRIG